jgi:hypothetical protein
LQKIQGENTISILPTGCPSSHYFRLWRDFTSVFGLVTVKQAALIAEYQTRLPQKALLENKLRELRAFAEASGSEGCSANLNTVKVF